MDAVDTAGVGHPESNSEVTVDVADPVEQLRQLPIAVVPAVDPGVLSGHPNLLGAGVDQRAGLLDVLFDSGRIDPTGRELRDTVRAVAHAAARDGEDTDDAV